VVECARLVDLAYLQLRNNVGSTKEGRLLKGEHGVVFLYYVVSQPALCLPLWGFCSRAYVEARELGAVGVEGAVVVLDELLCIGMGEYTSLGRLGGREQLTGKSVEVWEVADASALVSHWYCGFPCKAQGDLAYPTWWRWRLWL